MKEKDAADAAKLQMLREAAPEHAWRSLDETRHCILCERIISGRQITLNRDRRGVLHLSCPTHGCCATSAEWVHPGNPLVSEEAWRDWMRVLESLCDDEMARRKPTRRFRPTGEVPRGLTAWSDRLAQ